MLIKEYRIPLPLTVDEYKIAQLYMIAKKSRDESKGAGSGVEILVNEPYTGGPGPNGTGQYTRKVFHIGSHLPGWLKSLMPKSALIVEEEAWNAYPYTKTKYKCPFVERFTLEIETYYFNDDGSQENVFGLSKSELRERLVDIIDIVKDQTSDCIPEEDPRIFTSGKTGRGPLRDSWIEDYWKECRGCVTPLKNGKALMCAYKLCKVEFKYWGMQTKIEHFIDDVALRRTMVRAHKQAWVWQDEWWGLTIDDIRQIERETQEALAAKMAQSTSSNEDEDVVAVADGDQDCVAPGSSGSNSATATPTANDPPTSPPRRRRPQAPATVDADAGVDVPPADEAPAVRARVSFSGDGRHKLFPRPPDRRPSRGSRNLEEDLLTARMESIAHDSDHGSEASDEFYDARDDFSETLSLTKWNSVELIGEEQPQTASPSGPEKGPFRIFPPDVMAAKYDRQISAKSADSYMAHPTPASPLPPHCPTICLLLVFHGGSVLEANADLSSKKSDVTTFRGAFESVMRQHYPCMIGRVAIRLVPCPAMCSEALGIFSSLSPYSFDVSPTSTDGNAAVTRDAIPIGAVPLFMTSSPDYAEALAKVIIRANAVYHEFLKSEEGVGFAGQVSIIGDSAGAIFAYDALSSYSGGGSHDRHNTSANRGSLSSESLDKAGVGRGSSPGGDPQPLTAPQLGSSSSTTSSSSGSSAHTLHHGGNHHGNPFLQGHQGSSMSVHSHPSQGSHKVLESLVESETWEPGESGPAAVGARRKQSCQKSFSDVPGAGDAGSAAGDQHQVKADHAPLKAYLSAPAPRSYSISSCDSQTTQLDFEVTDFFLMGSPLSIILAFRRIQHHDEKKAAPARPACFQMFNLFHPANPVASRLEPLLSSRFAQLPPLPIPRYSKYPMGDGTPNNLLEYLQSTPFLLSWSSANPQASSEGSSHPPLASSLRHRRISDSLAPPSSASSVGTDFASISAITAVSQKWWGNKRIDYALYCPEGLTSFPTITLPHLFHASYWESHDVIAFILRQLMHYDPSADSGDEREATVFSPSQPREKWLKKRTSVKIKNCSANHRGNDVIIGEGMEQILTAKFAYGPLDVVALTGEKIDIHAMPDTSNGEWVLLGTETTDKNGRVKFRVPQDQAFGHGVYPIKMVVRGDHTCADLHMAVVPKETECVVFSIDGSFTASVSVTAKDPRVRPGAVDVVRHWQEHGYLIIYITGRPDMQQRRVISWLAQHNFPHGLISFADGVSKEFLTHKAEYLSHLVKDVGLVVHAGYGSSKDIGVYQSLGLKPDKIHIVGKISKKHATSCNNIADGYAVHLNELMAPGGCRPAQGNARILIPRGFFSFPGQGGRQLRRSRSVKRTPSFPAVGGGTSAPTTPVPSQGHPSPKTRKSWLVSPHFLFPKTKFSAVAQHVVGAIKWRGHSPGRHDICDPTAFF